MTKKQPISGLMKRYLDEAVICSYGVVPPSAIIDKMESVGGACTACDCYLAGANLIYRLRAEKWTEEKIVQTFASLSDECDKLKAEKCCQTCGCPQKGNC